MDPRMLRYYSQELQYIREMGAEFAERFPKIAARLALDSTEVADPYVERLLEGFSFLSARIRLTANTAVAGWSNETATCCGFEPATAQLSAMSCNQTLWMPSRMPVSVVASFRPIGSPGSALTAIVYERVCRSTPVVMVLTVILPTRGTHATVKLTSAGRPSTTFTRCSASP